MRIGIAGPITLKMLSGLFPPGTKLPGTYSFPLIATLAEKLRDRGHEVVVFALSSSVVQTQHFTGDRIEAYVCPRRRPRWQMLDFFRGERLVLRKAMQQSRCDVIHAHWTYEFGAAAVASGLPHVVTAHDVPMAVLRFARHLYWWERPWLAWGVLRKAQRVTAVSPYVAESLHRFPWPQRDIAVVCNGVPQAVFDLYAKRHIWPRSNKLVFASVLNGWRGRKNGQELIKAFSLVREVLGEGVELWMFGEGHQQDGPAHAWAAERLLDQGIHFGGTLPYGDLLDRLTREVDVLVHPALEESFGMVLAEAMAIGLPVVAGRNSGATAWVLADGGAGMLVDVNSPPSIAAGLRTVAEDARLRARLASAGRERALKEYHIDLTVTRYEEILGGASME